MIFQVNVEGIKSYFGSVESNEKILLGGYAQNKLSEHIDSLGYEYWEVCWDGSANHPNRPKGVNVVAICKKNRFDKSENWTVHFFAVEMPK